MTTKPFSQNPSKRASARPQSDGSAPLDPPASPPAPEPSEPWRRRFVPPFLRREKLAGQMVRFGIVGGMNTAVDWGLFFVFNLLYNSVSNEPLVSHRYLYLLANAIAFSAGIANSFLWNKHWTFNAGGSRRWRHEVIVFLMVSLASLAINTAGLQVLRSMITGTSLYTVAIHKLGTTVVTMTWNFFGYRFLAFRHAASSTGSGEPRE